MMSMGSKRTPRNALRPSERQIVDASGKNLDCGKNLGSSGKTLTQDDDTSSPQVFNFLEEN